MLAFFSPNSSPPFPILARCCLASSAPRLARPLGSRVTKQINASTHTFRDAHTHRAFRRPPPFRSRRERAIRFSRSRSCARGCRGLASRAVRLPFRARPLARGWAPPGERPIRDARPRAMTVFAPPIPRDDATERDTRIANPRFARAPSGRTIRFASRGAPSSSSSRSRQTPRPPPRPKLPPPGANPALAEKENANVIRAAKAYGDHHAGAEARARVLNCAFDGNRPRTPPRANEPERARGTTSLCARSLRKPPIATRPTSDGASRSRSRDTGLVASTSPSGTVSPVSSSDGSPRALDASAPAWAPGSAALDMWEKPRRQTHGARPGGARRAWSADASPYAASLTGTLPHIRTRGVGDASGWAFGSKRAKARRRRSSRTRDVVDAAESLALRDPAALAAGYKEEAELWESRAAVLTQEREALREECAAKDGELLVLRERLEALESAARVASPAGSSAGSSESPPSRGNHPRG